VLQPIGHGTAGPRSVRLTDIRDARLAVDW